jgi:hypothetical protein
MDIQIYNYLILTTIHTSDEEWEKVFDFLSYKKRHSPTTRLITTSGRDSFKTSSELAQKLEDRQFPYKGLAIMSCPEPAPAVKTYERLEVGLSFQYYDDGLLLISDSPLEDLLKPIQVNFKFVDSDLGIDNTDLLVQYVLSIRKSPNLLIYDARSTRFIN